MSAQTPFTPTDEGIRNCYVYSKEMYDGSLAVPERVSIAEFDRWIAVHDSEVLEPIRAVLEDPKYGRDDHWVVANIRGLLRDGRIPAPASTVTAPPG